MRALIRRNGYTLIELITVTSLSVLLLSLSVAAFYRLKRPADVEASAAVFRAAAAQARSAAVAKLSPCRVIVEHAPRGDMISVERRTITSPYKWIKMSATNTLVNTSVSFPKDTESKIIKTSGAGPVVYFRADGSCCTDEEDIGLPDRQDDIQIDFISAISSDREEGRIRSVIIDPHSGLSVPGARSYSDGR